MLKERPTVAVIEDDVFQRKLYVRALSANDCNVWGVSSAEEFFRQALVTPFDIAVVDLGLPGESGLSLIRHVSKLEQVGLIAITGNSLSHSMIEVWQSGVDNFMEKPIAANELAIAVQILWQRISKAHPSMTVQAAPWVLSASDFSLVSPEGKQIALSHGEMDFIRILARTPQEVVSNEVIVDDLFPDEPDAYHRLNMLISRLRKKFKVSGAVSPVRSIFGRGRVFAAELKSAEMKSDTTHQAEK